MMLIPPWLIILIALMNSAGLLFAATPGLKMILPYCHTVEPYAFACVKMKEAP